MLDQAAAKRENHLIQSGLIANIIFGVCADCHADADLARTFSDRDEHDVHY